MKLSLLRPLVIDMVNVDEILERVLLPPMTDGQMVLVQQEEERFSALVSLLVLV